MYGGLFVAAQSLGEKMIDDMIQKYINEGQQAKVKLQSRLFTLFTETTGHRPEDLCLVEQQIVKGTEFKTIYKY